VLDATVERLKYDDKSGAGVAGAGRRAPGWRAAGAGVAGAGRRRGSALGEQGG
jgi:hypothetical protein